MDENNNVNNIAQLCHYGVLGMKWGRKGDVEQKATDDKVRRVKSFMKKTLVVATASTSILGIGKLAVDNYLNGFKYSVNGRQVSRSEFNQTIKTVRDLLKDS